MTTATKFESITEQRIARARQALLVTLSDGSIYAVDGRDYTLPANHEAWDALAAAVESGEAVESIPAGPMAFRLGTETEEGAFGRVGGYACMVALRELSDDVLSRPISTLYHGFERRCVADALAGYIYDRSGATEVSRMRGAKQAAPSATIPQMAAALLMIAWGEPGQTWGEPIVI